MLLYQVYILETESKTYKLLNIFLTWAIKKNDDFHSFKNNKVIVKVETETPENVFVDEFLCLRIKACSFIVEVIVKKLNKFSKSHSELLNSMRIKILFFEWDYQKERDKYSLKLKLKNVYES